MKRSINFIKQKVTLLGAVVIAAILGGATTGIVMAAIPDSQGKINACYRNNTHALSVTDPAGSCNRNETPISWDQSSGGHIYSKAIDSIPIGASPQTLFSIPNVGVFALSQCAPDASAEMVSYTNTTGGVATFNNTIVNPNETKDVASASGNVSAGHGLGLSDLHYTLSYVQPGSQKIVSLWLGGQFNVTNDGVTVTGCDVRAQATVSN